MLVLAIDPGIEKVGFAYFEKKMNGSITYQYLTSGLIRTSRADHYEKRLYHLFNQLKKLVVRQKPDLIVFEQLFFFQKRKDNHLC